MQNTCANRNSSSRGAEWAGAVRRMIVNHKLLGSIKRDLMAVGDFNAYLLSPTIFYLSFI